MRRVHALRLLLRRSSGLLVALAAGAALASAPAAHAATSAYFPDQLVVRFAPSAGKAERGRLRARAGARVADVLPSAPGVQLLDLGDGESVREAQAALEQAPEVLYAEPNFRLTPDSAATAPNDPRLGEQWHLGRIEALRAWDFTTGSHEVVAAVIDSGVEIRHPDLQGNLWTNPGEHAR